MSATTIPWIKPQFFTDTGEVAAGYKLYTYDAGTATKRNTYTTSALSAANANPIVLDADGRASIFLLPQFYKFVLAVPAAADPPLTNVWSVDFVPAYSLTNTFDVGVTAGEAITANEVVYLSDGSGALTAGRWYKADADNAYSSSSAVVVGLATAAIASATAGTVRLTGRVEGLSGLTPGAAYYVSGTAGGMTATPPAKARIIGKAESATVLVLDPAFGVAGAAIQGLISSSPQTFSGLKTFNTQPASYGGAASTLPFPVGGVYFTDVTQYDFPASGSAVVGTSTSIPANMLNADGKAVQIWFGSSTAPTGSNQRTATLTVNVTNAFNYASNGNNLWYAKIILTRTSSSTMDCTRQALDSSTNIIDSVGSFTGIDYTAAIPVVTTYSTGVASTMAQTFFVLRAL